MNKWKVLAIVFALLTFGAVQETFRIFTSADADIADNRTGLMPMAIILTAGFAVLTIVFWVKSTKR